MKCNKHPNDILSKEDFYWKKDGKLSSVYCKNCVLEKAHKKTKEKEDWNKMFAV